MKYVIAASILALAVAILIYALMPRYYLILAFADQPVLQIGPFASKAGCETARRRIPDAMFGNSNLTEKDPSYEESKESIDKLMVCVSSR